MNRMKLFTLFISLKKTSSYGMCHVDRPSLFWPDEGVCRIDEISRWKSDLRKEQEGITDFQYYWGMGENFEKPMDIEMLLNAFSNVEGA